MKILVATNSTFGSEYVLQFKEVSGPNLRDDDFLLQGEFATVSTADIRLRSKKIPRGFKFIMSILFGFRKPKYESLGTDYVGKIVKLGKSVQGLQIGDRVVVDLGMSLNGYRTYKRIQKNDTWVKLPDHVSSEDAVSAVFGGLTALLYLRDKLKIKAGERVLVIGAGGAVGSSAVQLAKYYGAEVVAVCSAGKSQTVLHLGVDRVQDYNVKEWNKHIQNFDLILDCVGVLNMSVARRMTQPNGKIGFIVADLELNLKCLLSRLFERRKFVAGSIQTTKKDLQFIIDLIANGELKPLIGKKFLFKDLKAAHREVESGHRTGSTLICY